MMLLAAEPTTFSLVIVFVIGLVVVRWLAEPRPHQYERPRRRGAAIGFFAVLGLLLLATMLIVPVKFAVRQNSDTALPAIVPVPAVPMVPDVPSAPALPAIPNPEVAETHSDFQIEFNHEEMNPAWLKLGLVSLVGLALIAILVLVPLGTLAKLIGKLILLGAVAGVVFLVYRAQRMADVEKQVATAHEKAQRIIEEVNRYDASQIRKQERSKRAGKAAVKESAPAAVEETAATDSSNETETRDNATETTRPGSAESSTSPSANSEKKPDWVAAPPQNPALDLRLLDSGPYVTADECDAGLVDKIEALARSYLSTLDLPINPYDMPIDREVLRKMGLVSKKTKQWVQKVETQYGEMQNKFALIQFSDLKDYLGRLAHDTAVNERLTQMGQYVAAVLALLASVYGYLRLKAHKFVAAH